MMENATVEYEYDEELFVEEADISDTHPLIWSIGLGTMIAYIVIFCFGVPANVYVLYRLRKLAKKNKRKYRHGAGMGLFVMTVSDLVSLLAISLQHVLSAVQITAPDFVKSLACKVRTIYFSTHALYRVKASN